MPIEKILNPLTNRWVKADGKIGKKILKEQKQEAPKKKEPKQKTHIPLPKDMGDRYIPVDIVRKVAQDVSPKTFLNLARANKELHKELKIDASYARRNGVYLLKFLQNLDTYYPLMDPIFRDRYNKEGFTRNLFTLYYKGDHGSYYLTLSIRLYKSPTKNEKRVMMVTSDTKYKKPREGFVINYVYTDSLNYTGTKLSKIVTGFNPATHVDAVTGMLRNLQGISFIGPYLDKTHRVGRKEVHTYAPISEDPLLKEWYDYVYKNKSPTEKKWDQM